MRSSHRLDRLDVAFDDDRLVADAGLLLPATLAQHLGLGELVDEHLDLGARPGNANRGDKLLTLVLSALAGGDCIDDADALRSGGTERVLGFRVKAASTLGTFLRSFRWGHVRQLDAVSRHLLARAWAAGAGPGSAPLTIDLDSTICETYGLAKEGGTRFTHTGVRGYHPLLAVAAGTGDILMARLRGGNANSGRSAGHFLRETIGRVRGAGATGELTMRADSGFYAHAVVAVCRRFGVRFSITLRQHRSIRRLIEAIPEDAWTPIPYWLEGGADVAETTYTPFAAEKDAVPVRLIVRRVKPTPGSQLALFALHDFHAFITDRDGETLALEGGPPAPRRDRERHPRSQVRDGPQPPAVGQVRRQRRLAVGPGARPQPRPLDRPARSRCRDRHDQDPPPAAVRAGRSADPLGPEGQAPPAGALALGDRLDDGAHEAPGDPAPHLTDRGPIAAAGPAGACPDARGGPSRTPNQRRRESVDRRSAGPAIGHGRRRLTIASAALGQAVGRSVSVDPG